MNITESLGKRVLITELDGTNLTEVKIVEISPAGSCVKLMKMDGNKYWRHVHELVLVEVLKDETFGYAIVGR